MSKNANSMSSRRNSYSAVPGGPSVGLSFLTYLSKVSEHSRMAFPSNSTDDEMMGALDSILDNRDLFLKLLRN